jgi:hypothetical protein
MASSVSVAVFIDWQNAYKRARYAFGLDGLPSERGNISPLALAQALAAGRDRGSDGVLVRVEIHRGLPSNRRDRVGYGATRAQSTAWIREDPSIVIPCLRPLRYDPLDDQAPPVEKGIDVQLALNASEWAITARCDVAIVFSHDTDLEPAIEFIARMTQPSHVETASWRSDHFSSRLKPVYGVHHHYLDEATFRSMETPFNYAYKGQRDG